MKRKNKRSKQKTVHVVRIKKLPSTLWRPTKHKPIDVMPTDEEWAELQGLDLEKVQKGEYSC